MKNKGFTLIELLLAIAVLAIILSITVPVSISLIRNSKMDAFKSHARLLIQSINEQRTKNINFDVFALDEENIEELLGIQPENFYNLDFAMVGSEVAITVNGSGVWDGYTVCGTYKTLTAVIGDECELPYENYPIDLFIGDQATEYTQLNDVVATATGYAAVGLVDDNEESLILIVGYDNNRNQLWSESYDLGYGGELNSITAVADGYVAVGYQDYGTDDYDTYIVKFDLTGNILWDESLQGENGYDEEFNDVIAVSDGFVAVGYNGTNNGDFDGYNYGNEDAIIVKYDLNGNLLWINNVGGTDEETAFEVVDTIGGYVVTGDTYSDDNDFDDKNNGSGDIFIAKFSNDGTLVFSDCYGGSLWDDSWGGIVAVEGGFILAGFTSSTDGDMEDVDVDNNGDSIIVKFNSGFAIEWIEDYGGNDEEWLSGISTTPQGIVVTGTSFSNDGDLESTPYNETNFVVEFDNYGNVIKSDMYDGENRRDGFYGVGFDSYRKRIIVPSDYEGPGGTGCPPLC